MSGTITDAKDSSPVPGANILVEGSAIVTISDANGKFTIQVKPGDIIEVSFVGFETQQITISDQTEINIQLKSDATALNEVVVTALGISKLARSIGYATQSISTQQRPEPITAFWSYIFKADLPFLYSNLARGLK